jgi:hypothetical protein
VPLPEHEQRQLQQIEQALCRDDPKFGRLMRAIDPRVHYAWPCQPRLAPQFSFDLAPRSVAPGWEFSFDLAPP